MNHIFAKILGVGFLLTTSLKGVADESSFSGRYIGFETGYGSVELNDVKDTGKTSFGGVVGFRYQLESTWVLGIEGGYASLSYDGWGAMIIALSICKTVGIFPALSALLWGATARIWCMAK